MDFSQRKSSTLWFPQALLVALASLGAVHAGAAEVASPAASAAVSKTAVKPAVGKVVVKTPATAAAVTARDDNQYPTGSIPIPPKPKKDGPEAAAAAAAVKAKAAQP